MEPNKPATHAKLIEVAIDRFGRAGLEGATTRDIAARAGTPMSAITYHFGSKEGLHLAAARHIADQLGCWLGAALDASMTAESSPEQARAALHMILATGVGIMTRPETESFARFILREQADPTEAFTILYDHCMGRILGRAAALMHCVSGGRLDPDEAKLRAIMLIGQVLIFRAGRAAVLRATGWSEIGGAEQDAIRAVARQHLDAILDSLARGEPA